jgi:hypothetical protein
MKVKVSPWANDAGQKWKSKQPRIEIPPIQQYILTFNFTSPSISGLAKSFEFKPTSNLKTALDAGGDLNSVFSRVIY